VIIKKGRLILGALIVVVSTCLSLLGVELALRQFYPQQLGVWYNTRDKMVIHPPNLKVYLSPFNQEVRFNSFGMRDREHTVDKEEGTFRILLLGDSFMEALQVPFVESFPKLLETRLQHSMPQVVEVINSAVSGWATDDQLAYLTRYGVKYKPDLILVAMTIHNDLQENMEK